MRYLKGNSTEEDNFDDDYYANDSYEAIIQYSFFGSFFIGVAGYAIYKHCNPASVEPS